MSQINPYQPPRSPVADVAARSALGAYVEGGRAVEAGHGWTWIAAAFDLFRKRPGAWIIITVILCAMLMLTGLLPVVGFFINTVLMPVYIGGLLLGCRALEDGGDFGVGQLFAGFTHGTRRLIAIGVLSGAAWIVIMMPLAAIMGKSFFAFMRGDPSAFAAMGPGVGIGFLVMFGLSVPIYMALWFSPGLVLFHHAEPIPALRQSFRACLKNVVPFLVYGVIAMVLMVVAAIPLGLGLLVWMPVTMASLYTAYRDIFYLPG
jgi:hypothetical protein